MGQRATLLTLGIALLNPGTALAIRCPDSRGVEQPVTSYAFATELGSGIYDVDGRTLQIYRLPLMRMLQTAAPGQPAVRLRVPVTAGIFNFRTPDILQGNLPSRIDMLNVVPGIELVFTPAPQWLVLPYIEAGGSIVSSSQPAAGIAGAGVRTEHRRPAGHGELLFATRLSYVSVNYSRCISNDDLLRVRGGLEWRRGTGRMMQRREIEIGGFGLIEWFADRPRSPVTGRSFAGLQAEAGLSFGLQPAPRLGPVAMPRLGLSYRFAGELSGWRFVIGAPL